MEQNSVFACDLMSIINIPVSFQLVLVAMLCSLFIKYHNVGQYSDEIKMNKFLSLIYKGL